MNLFDDKIIFNLILDFILLSYFYNFLKIKFFSLLI